MSFGQPLRHLTLTGSTNEQAHRWALEGAPHGALVRADAQTQGRGRQGREWCSPDGLGLYLSLILRPAIELARVPQLTMLAALAAMRAVESQTGFAANVKWPNDIVLRNRKIGGVLSEAKTTEARVDFVIVGIGLNVNFSRDDLPHNVKIPASSLYIETGQVHSPDAVLQALLDEMEALYDEYSRGAWPTLRQEFERRDILQGRTVLVENGNESYYGQAAGIDLDGLLLVRRENDLDISQLNRVVAGDVRLAST